MKSLPGLPPDIKRFIDALVSASIYYPGEAEIISRVHRDQLGRPNWGAIADVAAVRAAHKKKRDYT